MQQSRPQRTKQRFRITSMMTTAAVGTQDDSSDQTNEDQKDGDGEDMTSERLGRETRKKLLPVLAEQ